jgi:pimeloyl-ACP methyl ester carboxylesterase
MNVNEIKNNNPEIQSSFVKIRLESNSLWKKIRESECFQYVFRAAATTATGLIFTTIIAPVGLAVAAVNFLALVALGLASPALLHPTTSKIWRTVKDKIFGLFTDLMCLPHAALITPLAFKPNVSLKEKGEGPVVVFVHGFLHNKTCWESLTYGLGQCSDISEKDIYAINLGEPLTVEQIDHYASYLATKLEQLRKHRGVDKLDVVLDCHSMGGLVSAKFALKYAESAGVNVLRLISNGTPWHGTPMAIIGSLTECGKEMLPDNHFHQDLTNEINANPDLLAKIYTIASKGDTVVPYHSAKGKQLNLPKDHKYKLKDPLGHVAMNYAYEAQAQNIKWITEAIEQHPILSNSSI